MTSSTTTETIAGINEKHLRYITFKVQLSKLSKEDKLPQQLCLYRFLRELRNAD